MGAAALHSPAPSPQYLRALDVIVQVVPECVDQVYGVVSGSSIGVTGEQHWKKRGTQSVSASQGY